MNLQHFSCRGCHIFLFSDNPSQNVTDPSQNVMDPLQSSMDPAQVLRIHPKVLRVCPKCYRSARSVLYVFRKFFDFFRNFRSLKSRSKRKYIKKSSPTNKPEFLKISFQNFIIHSRNFEILLPKTRACHFWKTKHGRQKAMAMRCPHPHFWSFPKVLRVCPKCYGSAQNVLYVFEKPTSPLG